MREAILYSREGAGNVRCLVCERRCLIHSGEKGYCGTRYSEGGKLYTLTYGMVAAEYVAPIEMKPLYHFYPGTRAYSLGSLGCNFRCIHCQNWHISYGDTEGIEKKTAYISPEEAVDSARSLGCRGISWTYNEPTIWLEYTIDGARLAKERGLYTNYVTNGYMTEEALDAIGPYLDAFRVDIKGFTKEFYSEVAHVPDFTPILKRAVRAKERWGMHVEVVTNIIPGYNDGESENRKLARWIVSNLGPDTPWHVTGFSPHLELGNLPPTPVGTLEKICSIGDEEELRYVYIGNVPGHEREKTLCPGCGMVLIERYPRVKVMIDDKKCPGCGMEIPIILS